MQRSERRCNNRLKEKGKKKSHKSGKTAANSNVFASCEYTPHELIVFGQTLRSTGSSSLYLKIKRSNMFRPLYISYVHLFTACSETGCGHSDTTAQSHLSGVLRNRFHPTYVTVTDVLCLDLF